MKQCYAFQSLPKPSAASHATTSTLEGLRDTPLLPHFELRESPLSADVTIHQEGKALICRAETGGECVLAIRLFYSEGVRLEARRDKLFQMLRPRGSSNSNGKDCAKVSIRRPFTPLKSRWVLKPLTPEQFYL